MKPSHGKTKDGKPSGFPLRPRRLGVPSWSPENKSFRGFFVDVFCAQNISTASFVPGSIVPILGMVIPPLLLGNSWKSYNGYTISYWITPYQSSNVFCIHFMKNKTFRQKRGGSTASSPSLGPLLPSLNKHRCLPTILRRCWWWWRCHHRGWRLGKKKSDNN